MTNSRTWLWIVAGRLAMFLVSGLVCIGQTITNSELVWSNYANVSLYVVLESPDISLPHRLWNVIGEVTNVPPSTNSTISFPVIITNRYPDANWLDADFFCVMAWTNGIPTPSIKTNWYALEMVEFSTLDSAGRTVGYGRQGHWFAVTNQAQPLASSIQPFGQMTGVTNNNPNFNILHF